jgi:heat-inducible transcriptional repressor
MLKSYDVYRVLYRHEHVKLIKMDTIELTGRQKMLLNLIVQEYVDTAKPIGSNPLVKKYNLDLSSATVRNEMRTLAEAGYLRQPHTSAGRVPTEEAYRFFVSQLMHRPELPARLKDHIARQFNEARQEAGNWMRLAASVLAHQAKAASIVTAPYTETLRFKQLQLISTTGRQVLMVVVMVGGGVSQQMLVLSESVTQDQLTATANQLNHLFTGRDVDEIINSSPSDLDALGEDIYKLVLDELARFGRQITGEVYQDGLNNVLSDPGFTEVESARKALRVLEERALLENLLAQTVMNTEVGGVEVLIGGESQWEELSDCSLVLARYGVPNIATGILGVLGPLRMPYGHTISTVNYMAGLLSNLVGESMDAANGLVHNPSS